MPQNEEPPLGGQRGGGLKADRALTLEAPGRGPVTREGMAAAVLVGVGCAALTITFVQVNASLDSSLAGTGEIGVVYVYAQLPSPTLLHPGRAYSLPRPHDLAFQFSVAGTGPREVRIELEPEEPGDAEPVVHYEDRLEAPSDQLALPFILTLDDTAPDRFQLVVTVGAPHRAPIETRYRLSLTRIP